MGLASQHLLAEAREPTPQVLAQEGLLLAQADQGFLLVAPLARLRFPPSQMSHELQLYRHVIGQGMALRRQTFSGIALADCQGTIAHHPSLAVD
jgi:hypothetical protein